MYVLQDYTDGFKCFTYELAIINHLYFSLRT